MANFQKKKKVLNGKRSCGSTDIAFEHYWAKTSIIRLLLYILIRLSRIKTGRLGAQGSYLRYDLLTMNLWLPVPYSDSIENQIKVSKRDNFYESKGI
jgi:hypothetical protein